MHHIQSFRGEDFGAFLLQSKIVAAGKEKYLVHWARKFFEFSQKIPSISWFEQLPLYLSELNSSGSYQDWQVRQADQAVRMYFSNFLMTTPSAASDTCEKTLEFNSPLHYRNMQLSKVFARACDFATTRGRQKAPTWDGFGNISDIAVNELHLPV